MPYWAHSEANGVKHGLIEHLNRVARLSFSFAEPFHCEELAYWAGLWHDLGKFSQKFQDYLENPSPQNKTTHSLAGMVWSDKQNASLIGLLIAGHHGGLLSTSGYRVRLTEHKDSPLVADSVQNAEASGLPLNLPKEFLPKNINLRDRFVVESLLRFVFSCLVDADFLDTESHFSPDNSSRRGNKTTLEALWRRLEEAQEPLLDNGEGVNRYRNEIYLSCLKAALLPPGFFSLTVPTGGGKTRSGMAFALKHALQHDLRRVIVALPYTSIIEQTADVYRAIFDQENVLEHHSAVDYRDDDESGEYLKMKLASENWDAPVIVTTTVQLFESLFSRTPSRMRKIHNIAGSVIILDEVQALPEKYLTCIQDLLSRLVEDYGCSIILSSATQPSLGAGNSGGMLKDIREIVLLPERYFSLLKRTEFEMPFKSEIWSWERVAQEMNNSPQALAVVNTKKDALALLDALHDPEAFHLSTNMCGAHRRDVLRDVRARLKEGTPCRLVSTQVVEAGVDLDFPIVLRAIGPLDRIVQAAGRCNREGKLDKGHVIIFRPEAGGLPPGAYRTGADTAKVMLDKASPNDLHDPTFYERYFRAFHGTVGLDPDKIQEKRARWDFPGVAESFRMVDENTMPVVVDYIGKPENLLDEVRLGNPRIAFRKLQPYFVNVRRDKLDRYARDGLAVEVLPGLYVWRGEYDMVRGISDKNIEPENFMW